MNTKQLNKITTHTHAALTHATGYGQEIEKLRPLCAGLDAAGVRAVLLQPVAAFYNVAVVESDAQRNKGELVLDAQSAKYEAARKALQRLVKDVMGETSAQREELAVPAHIAKLAAQLAAACAEYEQARKLASTAVAAAFAK